MGIGDFFSRGPTTLADVPVAAMRGLLRGAPMPEAPSSTPQGRPNLTPSQGVRSTPMPETFSPPPPMMRQSNEWGDLGKQAMGLMQELEPKQKPETDFTNYMRNLDKQIADMRAIGRADPQALYKGARDPNPTYANADEATGDYMARNASFESSNNPNAVNKGSGASGLFQFLPSTWRGIMKEDPSLGLTADGMFDVEQQKKAMNHYTRKSAGILSEVLGRKPSGGELYLLHLLGHSGGPNVLNRLDAPITATIDPAAYRSNPFLKNYKTGHDLIAGLNQKFGGG